MFNVMLVNTNRRFFHRFKRSEHLDSKTVQVFKENTPQFLSAKNRYPYADIVIIDLPQDRDHQLAIHRQIQQFWDGIPIIYLVEKGTSIDSQYLTAHTTLWEKPVVVDRLVEMLSESLNGSIFGNLKGISLSSLLQLIEIEQRTCTLKIKNHYDEGIIHCYHGRLAGATTATRKSLDAVTTMLGWTEPSIRFYHYCPEAQRRITMPIQFALLEAMRMKDESGLPQAM